MMNKIYTPQQIFNILKAKHNGKLLLLRLLPPHTYCTDHFSWAELLVNQYEMPTLEVLENLACVTNRLQALRDTVFGSSPIVINSAWRSEAYNKAIGGEPMSKHILGQAIDFIVKNYPPSRVQSYLQGFSGGLGAYKDFTHIDISTKRRWTGN